MVVGACFKPGFPKYNHMQKKKKESNIKALPSNISSEMLIVIIILLKRLISGFTSRHISHSKEIKIANNSSDMAL